MDIGNWAVRVQRARRAAHLALGMHESAASRIILLEDLLKELSGAPVDVQDYFREAISCLEHSLFRSGIVLAWAGFFHVFSETLFRKHEAAIRAARPKWDFRDLLELREAIGESHLLTVAKEVKFVSKPNLRILDGQLSQRNQCAHPTLYRPSMNTAIGYVDVMVRQTLVYMDQ